MNFGKGHNPGYFRFDQGCWYLHVRDQGCIWACRAVVRRGLVYYRVSPSIYVMFIAPWMEIWLV